MLDILTVAAKLALEIMKTMPNYEQKKKEKYYDLYKRYTSEKSKNYPDRDDNLISSLHIELRILTEIFVAEISGEKV